MSDLLEQLPVACFVLEHRLPAPSIQAINRRGRALLAGCSCGQPANRILERIAPEARDAFEPLWQHSLERHGALRWQGPLLGDVGDAGPHWVELELEPCRGSDGERLWQGVLIDLSAARDREQALQSRLNESRRLLDSVPIAIVIATLDGDDPEITTVNAEFERSFGYSHQQVSRMSAWAERAFPDPSYRQAVLRQWNAAVERARRNHGVLSGLEFAVTTATGEHKDVLLSARVLGSELLVTLLDVSERRRAERDLRSAREQLAHTALEITEAIPVGTYTMVLRADSPMASFSFMSERFLQLTGLKREEALADPLKAFACVHPEDYDAWVQLNARVFEQKLPFFGKPGWW